MQKLLLSLFQFFQQLLIKKGRGSWPAEALATPAAYSVVSKVLLPSPKTGADKSE
jgi:hypothetical protein